MPVRREAGLMLLAGLIWGAATLPALAQPTRRSAHIRVSGIWTEVFDYAGPRAIPPPTSGGDTVTRGPGAGVIWQASDPFAIPDSIVLADATDETWIAQNLNFQRLSYLQTTGDGTPIYEYDLSPEDPLGVAVASAEDDSLSVIGVRGASNITLRAFSGPGGETPLWTYAFDNTYNLITRHELGVSTDGALVAAAAYTLIGPRSLVVILDGATGEEVQRLETATRVTGLDLSDDGSRAVLTEEAVINVVETADLTTLHSFEVATPGGIARLSRDGNVVAAGTLDLSAYRDTGSGWSLIWHESDPNEWFGGGIALSSDGSTLFSASYDFPDSLDLTYRVIDLLSATELARTTRTGTGSYPDPVFWAQASADGQVFAVISWGTENNDHPEVQVFDRDARLLGSIDTPGSAFGLDLSRDGRYLVAGAKATHASIFGQGGDAYAYRVSSCHGDLDGDGVIELADLAALIAHYGLSGGASYERGDLDGDNDVDLSDLSALLALYGTTCP